VIGHVEEQVLQVQGVARDMQGDDLANPVARQLLPVGEAGAQHAANGRHVAFPGQIGRRLHDPRPVRQGQHGLPILLRQVDDELQPSQKHLKGSVIDRHHGSGIQGREHMETLCRRSPDNRSVILYNNINRARRLNLCYVSFC
jgi:hypothetical protein